MKEPTYVKRYAVNEIESERGWGSKVITTSYFETLEEADKFVKKVNSANNKPTVPDWYVYAEAPREVFIDQSKLKEKS